VGCERTESSISQKTHLKASPIEYIKLMIEYQDSKKKENELEYSAKEKIRKYKHNMQDLWDTTKRLNL
jgi:hypothetical protein